MVQSTCNADIKPSSRPVETLAHTLGSHIIEGFRHWRARRRLKLLMALDDTTLRDIGVSRGDVYWASTLPLTTDPLLELSKVSKRRYR